MAQWLERATDNRVVAGSNPTETAWKLWQFPLPSEMLKAVGPFYLVSMPGEVKYPTQGVSVQPVVDSVHVLPGQ